MLSLIKKLMTLNGSISGYKTYIGAFFLLMGAIAGWGAEVVMPWANGDITIWAMLSASAPHFSAMAAAIMGAGLRNAIK